ncbi:zinc finger MYM-type protein 1-like [Zingiber officinale]|uniref:zinc finger MYM-type protein 1-like n=1 Tax=Zingiber officinale TaxID=94328 RepID=UPI001C4BF8B2|nr:zinc finger MYM-type protein 1-like [Zingiber officinale]
MTETETWTMLGKTSGSEAEAGEILETEAEIWRMLGEMSGSEATAGEMSIDEAKTWRMPREMSRYEAEAGEMSTAEVETWRMSREMSGYEAEAREMSVMRMGYGGCLETTNAILADLGDRWFTLLLDEARDCSVKEQMAVVIRYVNKHGEEAIDSLFAKYGLSVARLRGQGYDGASNMSGEFNGLKSLIMKENPYVLYVHCFAHQLQLVVVAVAQANQYVCDFMWIVGSIVNTSASSCKRADKLRQLEHDRKVKLLERGEISSEVLQNLIDDGDRSSKDLSRTLVERMEMYEFVFILLLMKRILAITNHLSTVLQEKDQNIVNAMRLINNVKCKLQKLRDSGWDILLEDVKKFCNTHSIEIINMTDNINSRSRLKRDGKNVIDIILQEMDSHFSETTTDLLIYMSCLDPRNSFSRFDVQKLVRLTHFYEDDFSWNERMLVEQELETYIDDVRSDERFEDISDLGALAKKMIETMKNRVFPLVYRMIELALLLPVATATVERVFSAMNIVKTDLRNRIGDE